jgi:hypothetical protein
MKKFTNFPSQSAVPLLLLCLAAFFSGCRPCDDPTNPECPNYCVDETDPACPNYDPCWDQEEVSAAFLMYEYINSSLEEFWKKLDADTVRWPRVRFEALTDGASYHWQIGARTYDTREVTLLFDEVQRNAPWQTIPITLKVEKEPNTSCFPSDNGRDSLTRYLTIADECSTKLNGEYVGYWEGTSPEDTFSISIEVTSDSTIGVQGWDCIAMTMIPNLDREGCLHRSFTRELGYVQMHLDGVGFYENSCRTAPPSFVWLIDDSLFVNYSLRDKQEGTTQTPYFFRGVRK